MSILSRSFSYSLAHSPMLLPIQSSSFGHAAVFPSLRGVICLTYRSLRLLLALTGNDLDSLGLDIVRVIQLELDVLDNEGPDLVAEAVGVEMSL
jgi:hypothetical protein